jgi:hypothetical protein
MTAALMRGLGDGALVLAGQVGQNLIVRNTPALPIPGGFGDLAKDVLALIVGGWGISKVLGNEKARFFVAGQVSAAGARILRGLNIPIVSSSLTGYDRINLGLGDYVSGRRAPVALPAGSARARTLAGVGVYVDAAASSAMP